MENENAVLQCKTEETRQVKNDYTIASVQKALRVLKLFDRQHKEMTLTEISQRADMRKGTMLRILETLREENFVRYDERARRYQLGLAVYLLSSNGFEFGDLAAAVRKYAEEPIRRLNMVGHLAILRDDRIILIDRILPNESFSVYDLNSYVGGEIEPHCTGVGKVLVAFSDPETAGRILDGCSFERKSENTITDRTLFESTLRQVRQQGFAVNTGENEPYLKCITYPLFGGGGRLLGALSFTGVIQCVTEETERESHRALKEISRMVLRDFG